MTQGDGRRATGAGGEELAANYLTRRGWQVLARNWRCATGEVDIIARDPDGVLVFCEVKTRRGRGFGAPLEAITYAKVRKLRSLVAEFCRGLDRPVARVRIDGLGLVFAPDGTAEVAHVRGIG